MFTWAFEYIIVSHWTRRKERVRNSFLHTDFQTFPEDIDLKVYYFSRRHVKNIVFPRKKIWPTGAPEILAEKRQRQTGKDDKSSP